MTSFAVVYKRAGNDVAVAGLACTLYMSALSVTSLVNMTSFQATVVYQRAGNDFALAGLAGSWAVCPLSKRDVNGKYDVISGKIGVTAGGQ
jgi:hypothetical protein